MATAALDSYSEAISSMLKINHTVATSTLLENIWNENVGSIKANGVANLIKTLYNVEIINLFYTDHIDDLPMMRFANKIILVNPKPITIQEIRKYNFINLEIWE